MPWLRTSLQVGISDSAGLAKYDPVGFCPGKTVIAEVAITNDGCAASRPSTTEVTLEDPNATPGPRVIVSQPYQVPALGPGRTHRARLSLPTPSSTAGTSGTLGVRVNANAKVDNPDQCDRTTLAAWIAKPFAPGGAPLLTLTIAGTGVVRPGEAPLLLWSVHNACSAIGIATVTIRFVATATDLFRTQEAIAPQSSIGGYVLPGELLPLITPAIANAFWTIGTHALELEVAGNGPDGGPYRSSVSMNVVPEPIDATWWTWGTAPSGVWKSTYALVGTFANRGRAGMTLTAITALEHPTDVTGTAEDATVPGVDLGLSLSVDHDG